ncbi:MAG: HAD-IA family hydrolase [Phormidesmis sp.]
MSNAILFGSIGTVADTSELQRKAFNQAFARHNLDWNWSQEEYRALLESSGGQKRIADYAIARGQTVDAAKIHKTKSELFQQFLAGGQVEPRPSVAEIIERAKADGIGLALVTTTSEDNVSSLLKALGDRVSASDFDVVVDAGDVSQAKPAKDAYCYALGQLHQAADSCVAIEDNVGGVEAAIAAGITCLAFPNQNTGQHDFSVAQQTVDSLEFETLQSLLKTPLKTT